MSDLSTKPYLIRAIFEWCNDAGFTPYLSIKVDENVRVPMEYVINGEIVLSIATLATRDLTIGNEWLQFSARFNGVSREISVPIYAVQAIFARENGRGYFFEAEAAPAPDLAMVPTPDPSTAPLSSVSTPPYLQAVPSATPDATASNHAKNGFSGSITADSPADGILTDQPSGLETPANPDAPDSPNAPNVPKGPPRGNLRVIK